ANRQCEDILKQRRCGPFWCLPVFQPPAPTKRHTFIADSAERVSQSIAEADKSDRRGSPRRSITALVRLAWIRASNPVSFGQDQRRFVNLPPAHGALAAHACGSSANWRIPMATQRIYDFLATKRPEGPCLVLDLEVVRENYASFVAAMPDTRIFYAVKANPAPEILRLLAELGSNFDCASVAEIEMAIRAGAAGNRISYGNTIKKERDIARAFELGVRLFAVDSCEEVEKVARAAPGARVFCRVLTDGAGAEWPLSRKFGCTIDMAVEVLRLAAA